MNKRLFLAMALSLLVLFSWQAFIARTYHTDNKEVTLIKSEKNALSPSPLPDVSSGDNILQPTVIKEVTLDRFETDRLKIEFINPGGRLYRVYLKDYQLNSGISGGLHSRLFEDSVYTLQKSEERLQLLADKNGHYLTQSLDFRNNSYYIELELKYENKNATDWTFNDDLILSNVSQKANPEETRLYEAVFLNHTAVRKNPLSIKNRYIHPEALQGLAFRDRYSTIIIAPQNFPQNSAYIEKLNGITSIGLELRNITVAANSQLVLKALVYCGPQEVKLLQESKLGFEEVVYYGGFDFISTTLLSVLNFFQRLTHSWGWALISLSIFVFLALYPLTLKQMRAMKQMQELQPQIEALRKTYKDNPQRLNKEIMELYRRHKANPLGGCLPMILQIPIFFGLYQALSRSIVLKGSQFLWIRDLAEPDRMFILSRELPFIGKEINLLPILMAIAMFFQQKLTMKSGAATSAAQEQQKLMVIVFPIMFGFIFYHFPSGLALYWFLNTLTSVILQWKTLKTAAPAKQDQ